MNKRTYKKKYKKIYGMNPPSWMETRYIRLMSRFDWQKASITIDASNIHVGTIKRGKLESWYEQNTENLVNTTKTLEARRIRNGR